MPCYVLFKWCAKQIDWQRNHHDGNPYKSFVLFVFSIFHTKSNQKFYLKLTLRSEVRVYKAHNNSTHTHARKHTKNHQINSDYLSEICIFIFQKWVLWDCTHFMNWILNSFCQQQFWVFFCLVALFFSFPPLAIASFAYMRSLQKKILFYLM